MKGNDQTRRKLLAAMSKAYRESEQRNSKLTVKSVASLAGVSHALVYRCYPDVLDKIRILNQKRSNVGNDSLSARLKRTNESLRIKISELEKVVSSLASKNAMLVLEVSRLRLSLQSLSSGVTLIGQHKNNSLREE